MKLEAQKKLCVKLVAAEISIALQFVAICWSNPADLTFFPFSAGRVFLSLSWFSPASFAWAFDSVFSWLR